MLIVWLVDLAFILACVFLCKIELAYLSLNPGSPAQISFQLSRYSCPNIMNTKIF